MKEMTAEQAVSLLQNIYLGTLKNESRITRKVIETVPADKWFLETVVNGVFDANPAMIPENVKTPAEIAVWYEERFAKNFDALTKLNGEQLIKMVDFRGMFQRPAVSFVMLGLHHTIHHRGQLSSYLRCMGAKVPSIYGESYDDAQAKKTAQA